MKHFDSLIADPPLPFELTHRPEEIRARLRAANPRVDDFAVKASIEPRFFAWTNLDTRQITISWVTREVLFKFNMLLWNRIFKTTDMLASSSSQPWNFHEDIRELAFAFMPYLALEYRQLDYMAVPFPRAYDERVLHNAVRSTTDQLYFLLSHEFAHAALHSDTEITAVRRSIEEEADALALNLTLRRDQGSPSDTFISITWLFQYLALSRLAGALLNDHPDPVAFAKEVSSRSRMPSLNCLAEAGDVKEIDRQSASLGSRYLWEISNALVDLKKMTGERFAEFLALDKMKLPDAPEFHLRVLRSAEAVFQWTAKNAK